MIKRRTFFLLLYVTAIGVAGGVYFQRSRQQAVVLERMDALQSSLIKDSRLSGRDMIYTLRSLQKAVWDNRNQPPAVAVRTEGERIVARTQSLVDSIRAWRQQLRLQAGDAIVKNPEATETNEETARQLVWQLDRYAGFLATHLTRAEVAVPDSVADFTDFTPTYLTRTAVLQQLEVGNKTGWPFASGAPLASALASLTILEAQIQNLANEALMQQAIKVSYCGVRFDKFWLNAVPASMVVAPGADYESLLFFAKGAGGHLLRMTVDGKPVPVKDNALGEVRFVVPPLQPGQPDTVRAQWRGVIEGRTYRGDTTWRLEVPYLIVKRPAL